MKMPKSKKLLVVKAPQCIATPDRAKQIAMKNADKRDTVIVPPKQRINRNPGRNKFFDQIITTGVMKSRKLKFIMGDDPMQPPKVVISESNMNFSGPRSRLTSEGSLARRRFNGERRLRHINFRRRKPHGRN